MLVSYSDSEGSDDEKPQQQASKPLPSSAVGISNSKFAIDKSTGKIKVNLQSKADPSADDTHEDAPAPKRPRLGQGSNAFSGFNAMLPAPKRENLPVTSDGNGNAPARKVFSLRTGAEPAFSRESDAELRELFAEHNENDQNGDAKAPATIPSAIPRPAFAKPAAPVPAGQPMMFKPLSVARNNKKKKVTTAVAVSPSVATVSKSVRSGPATETRDRSPSPTKKQKINLFSSGTGETPSLPEQVPYEEEDMVIEDLGPVPLGEDRSNTFASNLQANDIGDGQQQSQTLSSIAADLNLSAAERRQLFGRTANASSFSNVSIVNFNTDAEYAANQQLIASGETIQHNPVRAIASGKHSLQQLLNSAATQKEALEESFAAGRRNKREAGSKYGW